MYWEVGLLQLPTAEGEGGGVYSASAAPSMDRLLQMQVCDLLARYWNSAQHLDWRLRKYDFRKITPQNLGSQGSPPSSTTRKRNRELLASKTSIRMLL